MARGLAYHRHQKEKRKKKFKKLFRNMWDTTAQFDDNPHSECWGPYKNSYYEKTGPIIGNRFVGKYHDTNVRSKYKCVCEYCFPETSRQLIKHIDSTVND